MFVFLNFFNSGKKKKKCIHCICDVLSTFIRHVDTLRYIPKTTLFRMTSNVSYTQQLNNIKSVANTYLQKQTQPIIIPVFAKWFDINSIHSIETNYFKEFFSESNYKNKDIYKSTRNFIVNTYRLHPYEYLTITAIRRNLNLDIQSIIKIHSFLEKWGIINYQIDPRTKSSILTAGYTGHYEVLLDTPRGLKSFVPENAKNEESNSEEKQVSYKLELQENKLSKADDYLSNDTPVSSKIKYICQVCSKDITHTLYHNLRDKSNNLCVTCFSEAKFLTIYSSSDFLKLNINEENTWGSSDIFRLLEGIEMFENDWDLISKYCNKSKDACVLKFITLPIEDDHLIQEKEKKASPSNNSFEDNVLEALKNGLGDEDKKRVIENSNLYLNKYLNESNVQIQQLIVNKLTSLDNKIQKLDHLESKYLSVIKEYEESKSLLTKREDNLLKMVNQINSKLDKEHQIDMNALDETSEQETLENGLIIEKVELNEQSEDQQKMDIVEEKEEVVNNPNKTKEYKLWAL